MVHLKILNVSLICTGFFITLASLAADMIGVGDPCYGIGASQMAGAVIGIIVTGLSLLPGSIYRTQFPSLFLGILLLMIVPLPFDIDSRIQNLLHIPTFTCFAFVTFILFNKRIYKKWFRIVIPMGLLISFSVASEILQALIPVELWI